MAGLGPNKQFTCDIPGCRQCFRSEDHISPFLPRHEASSKMGLLPTDQTPTPTTIFRKCEEAGLLQALQVENPFDETFRKAAEGIRSGSSLLELPLHQNAQESLNTPQVIIPGTTDNESSCKPPPPRIVSPDPEALGLPIDPITPSPIVRREADTSDGNADENVHGSATTPSHNATHHVSTNSSANLKVTQQSVEIGDGNRSVQVLLRMPDGKLVQLSTLPVEPVSASGGTVLSNVPIIKVDAPPSESSDSESAVALQPNMSLAKMKLKQALMTNNCPAATAQSPGSKNAKNGSGQPAGPASSQHTAPPPTQKPVTNGEEDSDLRRRKFLERNRAAAMRCREKKKTWVQELERNSHDMLRTNQHLEKEVALLRSEVAHLKTLLLAHKDCPVTKALAQGQATLPGFITLPAPSTVAQPSTQTQLVSIAQPVSASASTVVIQPPAVRPVLVLTDPRFKRRRHTSGSDSSTSSISTPVTPAKDQILESSTFLKSGSAMLTTTTSAPVIISNFVTTTPAILTHVPKQAFILPKTDAPGVPPSATFHSWDRTEISHEKMHNRTISSTNVIKVNPNVMDRDVEIIGMKAKSHS